MRAGRVLYAGIDVGSLSTDVVLLDGNLAVVGSAVTATGASTRKAARGALDAALLSGGATEREIAFAVATGYGRESAEGADLAHLKPPHINPSEKVLTALLGRPVTIIINSSGF